MSRRRCVLRSFAGLATAALWLAAPAQSQIVFEPPTVLSLSQSTQGVLVADLDLDGHEDLVTVPSLGTALHTSAYSIFLGHGNGSFTGKGTGMVDADYAGSGAVGLLNADAWPDLAFVAHLNYSGSPYSTVLIYSGSGGANFTFPKDVGTTFNRDYIDVQALDVTADGLLDLVVLDAGSPFGPGYLRTFMNNASGGYLISDMPLSSKGPFLVLGDVNGDARPDAVTLNPYGQLDLLPGLAAGGFGPPSTTTLGVSLTNLVLHDLDGDGALDLALSQKTGVTTLLGDGLGHFTPRQTLALYGGPRSLAAGALDDDGVPDLLVSRVGSDDVAVLRGAGDGSFSFVTAVSNVTDAGSIALGDFDEDGRPDAAVAESSFTFGALALLSNASYAAGSPFTDLGQGLPGSHGFPVQVADGSLQAGTPVSFSLSNGPPLTTSTLVLGMTQLGTPFKNGTLVPSPDVLISGLPLDAGGAVTLAGPWPAGIPSGFSFWAQFWIADPAAPTHVCATSGLRATTP